MKLIYDLIMENHPLNKELTPKEKAKARGQAEMILAESKAGKRNFPIGFPMSEKEYVKQYIKFKDERAKLYEKLTPKERMWVEARAAAEMLLAEARAKAGSKELKFPTTEEDWINTYIKAQAQAWTAIIGKTQERIKVPGLKWVNSEWKLVYDWEEPPQWGTARSKVE